MRRVAARAMLVGCAVVIAAALAVLLWRLRAPPRPILAEFDRMEAAGLPTTCAEIYGISPDAPVGGGSDRAGGDDGFGELAAGVTWLEQAFGELQRDWCVAGPWTAGPDDTRPWFETASREGLAELGAWLERARPYFDRVDAGLAKPRLRLVATLTPAGLPDDADRMKVLRRTTDYLTTRAVAATSAADRAAAIGAQALLSSRLEVHSSLDLILVQVVRQAAIRNARRAAESNSLPALDLLRVMEGPLAVSCLTHFPLAARGDSVNLGANWLAEWDGWEFGRTRTSDWRRFWDRLRARPAAASPQFFLRIPAEHVAGAMRLFDEAARIDASSPGTFRSGIDRVAPAGPTDPAQRLADLRGVAQRLLRAESASRLARVALAAKAHREATGAWPASLDELAPALGGAVPTDPATDAPFGYTLGDSKVRLSATGDPGADDPKLRESLLVWEFPR